jgi:protein-L-isoaspartate(D-aspartate) O-methyltransferase
MLEALEVKKTDRVLEIGTGSGYAAALLAEIAAEVYTVERIEELAVQAEELLKELGYQNIRVKFGDGSLGWEKFAPYDSILVSAAAPYVPQNLIEQLSTGGKIVIPVGKRNEVQRLKVLTKKFNGKVKEKELEYVRFVPLIGEDSWK